MPALVVGIGGATASGKSTLADALHTVLESSVVVRQDAFYHAEEDLPRHPVFETNWDVPASFRNGDLLEQILKMKQKAGQWESASTEDPTLNNGDRTELLEELALKLKASHIQHVQRLKNVHVILVEGICLFSDLSGLVDHLDVKIFLSSPEPVLRQRREDRQGYLTASGSVFVDPPGYWEGLVWPAYLESNAFLTDSELRSRLTLIEHDSSIKEVHEIAASVLEQLSEFVDKVTA